MPTYYIGLDLGTSSTKAVAFSPDGEVLATQQESYPLDHPEKGAAVQDPDRIVAAAEKALQTLVTEMGTSPTAIGLVSVLHSLLLIDDQGNPLAPLMTWADTRAQFVAKECRNRPDSHDLFAATGVPMHAMSPLAKIIWWKQHDPDTFDRAARFVGIKDYLLYRWFGQWWIDESTASGTGLLHLANRKWHTPALERAGLSEQQLPALVSPTFSVAVTDAKSWPIEGIDAATPITVGAGDGCLANLGAGVLEPGRATLTIGTSGAVRMTLDGPQVDPQQRLFTYYLAEGHYVSGGASNNGGAAWEWCCQSFFPDQSFDEVLELVSDVVAGAAGLLCVPYVYGERAPLWDAAVTGRYLGITIEHDRLHFARAFIEGMFYNLRLSLGALSEAYTPATSIIANGGFTRSDYWVQLLADITGLSVQVADSPHGTAYGAALLARLADESLSALAEVQGLPISQTFEPDPETSAAYQRYFGDWKKVAFGSY